MFRGLLEKQRQDWKRVMGRPTLQITLSGASERILLKATLLFEEALHANSRIRIHDPREFSDRRKSLQLLCGTHANVNYCSANCLSLKIASLVSKAYQA